MIEMRLAHVDLARVRFAHSPTRELVASLLVLQDPGRQPMHAGWLSAARRQLGGLELGLLTALVPLAGTCRRSCCHLPLGRGEYWPKN